MPVLRLTGRAITLNGIPVTLNGPDLPLRLAFAQPVPRQGTILNTGRRKGEILNPVRKGRRLELIP